MCRNVCMNVCVCLCVCVCVCAHMCILVCVCTRALRTEPLHADTYRNRQWCVALYSAVTFFKCCSVSECNTPLPVAVSAQSGSSLGGWTQHMHNSLLFFTLFTLSFLHTHPPSTHPPPTHSPSFHSLPFSHSHSPHSLSSPLTISTLRFRLTISSGNWG